MNHDGLVSDKWLNYLPVYDSILNEYQQSNVNLLEIGVQNGGSLEIWEKYFFNCNRIVGIDVDKQCLKLNFRSNKISIIIGSSSEKETKDQAKKLGKYEIIIDDGSHTSDDIISSFLLYFECLKDDGVYIVEDLHCSYKKEYGGGIANNESSIEFFKKLIDFINIEHWYEYLEDKKYIEILDKLIKNKILNRIHSITFYNSICVIKKRKPFLNTNSIRIISGNTFLVERKKFEQAGLNKGINYKKTNNLELIMKFDQLKLQKK